MLGSLAGLLGVTKFVQLSDRARIELTDSPIAFRERLFELLESSPMGGFPVAQFDLQLMDTALHGFQFLQVSTKAIPIGEVFIELRDLVSQHPVFFLQDVLGSLSSSTGLLRFVELVRLSCRMRIELADPAIAFRKRLFELLKGLSMSCLSIAQLNI